MLPIGFAPTLTGPTLLNIINFVTPMKNRFKSTLGQNPTDLADIAAWVSSLGGGVQAGLDINQHGLTGSWYEAATSGQGLEMEFFPDLVAPGTADSWAIVKKNPAFYRATGSVLEPRAALVHMPAAHKEYRDQQREFYKQLDWAAIKKLVNP